MSGNKEIERKFLLEPGAEFHPRKSVRISQGYLNSNPERTVRVRIKDDKAFLTVKGLSSSDGTTRFEWEREISVEDAAGLIGLCERGVVEKTRHLVMSEDNVHIWEIDEFSGDNEGLTLAEIELESADEDFPKPKWLGKEVTGDTRYYNSSLSCNPYKNWKDSEK